MKKIGEPIDEKDMNDVSGGMSNNVLLANVVAGKVAQDEINGLIEGAKQTIEKTKDEVIKGVENIFK